jgi:hypothetical protein
MSEAICIVCGDVDTDVICDDGSRAHLLCMKAQACEEAGHQPFDGPRCFCGAMEHVETKGAVL